MEVMMLFDSKYLDVLKFLFHGAVDIQFIN